MLAHVLGVLPCGSDICKLKALTSLNLSQNALLKLPKGMPRCNTSTRGCFFSADMNLSVCTVTKRPH